LSKTQLLPVNSYFPQISLMDADEFCENLRDLREIAFKDRVTDAASFKLGFTKALCWVQGWFDFLLESFRFPLGSFRNFR